MSSPFSPTTSVSPFSPSSPPGASLSFEQLADALGSSEGDDEVEDLFGPFSGGGLSEIMFSTEIGEHKGGCVDEY